MMLPHILHPGIVTVHSKTLIDNTFSTHISKKAICGNLTSTMSDHLAPVFNQAGDNTEKIWVHQFLEKPNKIAAGDLGGSCKLSRVSRVMPC